MYFLIILTTFSLISANTHTNHNQGHKDKSIQQCIKMKNLLFNDLHDINKALIEWKMIKFHLDPK